MFISPHLHLFILITCPLALYHPFPPLISSPIQLPSIHLTHSFTPPPFAPIYYCNISFLYILSFLHPFVILTVRPDSWWEQNQCCQNQDHPPTEQTSLKIAPLTPRRRKKSYSSTAALLHAAYQKRAAPSVSLWFWCAAIVIIISSCSGLFIAPVCESIVFILLYVHSLS